MDKYEEENKKLQDLEFDFNVARITKQDEDIVKLAKGKYIRQLNKVRKLQAIRSKQQKD